MLERLGGCRVQSMRIRREKRKRREIDKTDQRCGADAGLELEVEYQWFLVLACKAGLNNL